MADLQSAALATWLRSLLSNTASGKSIDFSGCSECASLGQHEFNGSRALGAWHRLPAARRLLASRRVLGQVPGTGFQSGRQIASIQRRLGQVPGTEFQPGSQIASIPPRLGQVPGTGFQPGS